MRAAYDCMRLCVSVKCRICDIHNLRCRSLWQWIVLLNIFCRCSVNYCNYLLCILWWNIYFMLLCYSISCYGITFPFIYIIQLFQIKFFNYFIDQKHLNEPLDSCSVIYFLVARHTYTIKSGNVRRRHLQYGPFCLFEFERRCLHFSKETRILI